MSGGDGVEESINGVCGIGGLGLKIGSLVYSESLSCKVWLLARFATRWKGKGRVEE